MSTVLTVLLVVSLLCPVYTYAVYPLLLRLFPPRQLKTAEAVVPSVTVIIRSRADSGEKLRNLCQTNYPADRLELLTVSTRKELRDAAAAARGEILIFTDSDTEYTTDAVRNLVKPFADPVVGCVVGQLRRKPTADGKTTESAYWKYENWVKRMESRIGLHSGANAAIYAVRKAVMPPLPDTILNPDFYVATCVQQAGHAVVMAADAVAYEPPEGTSAEQFQRHVRDGAGCYQSLLLFRRMLLFHPASFVYVSHRVMKWLVPYNLICAFVCNAALAVHSVPMLLLFLCQALGYLAAAVWARRSRNGASLPGGPVGKLFSLLVYFLELNLAHLFGSAAFFTGKYSGAAAEDIL